MLPRALLIVAAALASLLPAQEPLTLKVQTRAVQINVAVKDAVGHPVRGLRPENFTIIDNGLRRPIDLFSAEEETRPTIPAVTLPPNVFSNRFPSPVASRRVTAILLDGMNTSFQDQAYARLQAIKAVDEMVAGDSIAIYVLRQTLDVLQNYTADRDRLLDALRRWIPQQPRQPDTSGQFAGRAELGTPGESAGRARAGRPGIAQMLMRERIEAALESLRAISKHMAAANGRKSILWITAGFPPNQDYREQIDSTINTINESNVAVYSVDARGLLPGRNAYVNIQIMQELAESTGGQAYYNRNDVGTAIGEAVADARYTYALAFYLPEQDLDGKDHKLTVKVDRPGLTLHYRRGYQAVANPENGGKGKPAKTKDSLTSEFLNPVDRSAVGIDARLDVLPEKNSRSLRIVIMLDPATVTQTQPDGASAMKLDQLIVEADAHGRILERIASSITVTVPPGKPKGVFSQSMPLREGADSLHIIVRDIPTGHTGSLTAPLAAIPPR